ncbi:Hypothetical protein PBC10988_40940 [Planctomycetales bacterium 10988]|nr:Hypothetical protein PBC10988_40940 [Planctomycetales bacterium 10988]
MEWIWKARGFDRVLVLLPGWGFDHRIFTNLDLPYNYLLAADWPRESCLESFSKELADKNLKTFSLLGWSLGALYAIELAKNFPEKVEVLGLASARPNYTEQEIETQKQQAHEDRTQTLLHFYRRCFLGQRSNFQWFEKKLLPDYQDKWTTAELLEGLNVLKLKSIDVENINVPLCFFQGTKDIVAPAPMIEEYLLTLPAAERAKHLIVKNAGHLPFLKQEFSEVWHSAWKQ